MAPSFVCACLVSSDYRRGGGGGDKGGGQGEFNRLVHDNGEKHRPVAININHTPTVIKSPVDIESS